MHLYTPYRSKVEQPDALQLYGMTNSETEKRMWKYVLLKVLGSCLPYRMEVNYPTSEVIMLFFL